MRNVDEDRDTELQEALDPALKPCPFCGYGAALIYVNNSLGSIISGITCKNNDCHAQIRGFFPVMELVDKWNNRT